MNRFSKACGDFGLIVSLKKTSIGQGGTHASTISISGHQFPNPGSIIADNINIAESTKVRLVKQAGENHKLKSYTKMAVYLTCILSTYCMGTRFVQLI